MNTDVGMFLFSLHHFAFVTFLLIFAFRPVLRLTIIAIFVPIFFFHAAGYGCPFTRVERYYHGHNITVIDPIMRLLGITITSPHRRIFQAYFSSLILFSMVFTVWVYPIK